MANRLLKNALIVNEGEIYNGYLIIRNDIIAEVGHGEAPYPDSEFDAVDNLQGAMLMPGVIDTHVHFRDPGLTHKADMTTESEAAVRGGVTSFIDMPNTNPATVSIKAWEDKMDMAATKSLANYAFFIGATNSNVDELLRADYSRVPGVKLFLGSSTGNMLVDSESELDRLFSLMSNRVIAVHAESEPIIQANRTRLVEEYGGGEVPIARHPDIRSRQACIEATRHAISMAQRHNARLHILHISTADELALLPHNGRITAETCPHYLWFDSSDYPRLGARIKCNPAIKEPADRIALAEAVANGAIDVIATDHAPHLPDDKEGDALHAASGMPGIQFSLPVMLTAGLRYGFDAARVGELMCHAPARLYGIERRGFIRPGYYADLAVVRLTDTPYTITDTDASGRCGWTPYAGSELRARVEATYVNGNKLFDGNSVDPGQHGTALHFCNQTEAKVEK